MNDEALDKRPNWGPDLSDPELCVVALREWGPDLLKRVSKVREEIGVPVQALRADRVLSLKHLLMAHEHQSRAHESGRSGAQDPGVDFLRFAAAEKQITKAFETLGVPLKGDERPSVLLVALGPVDSEGFRGAVESAGFTVEAEMGRAMTVADSARRYWDARFSLPRDQSDEDREARVFAAMALLALEG